MAKESILSKLRVLDKEYLGRLNGFHLLTTFSELLSIKQAKFPLQYNTLQRKISINKMKSMNL